jgi:hypothetical protein
MPKCAKWQKPDMLFWTNVIYGRIKYPVRRITSLETVLLSQ